MNPCFQIRIWLSVLAAPYVLLAFGTACGALPPEEKLWNQPPVVVKPVPKIALPLSAPTAETGGRGVDIAAAIKAYNKGRFDIAKSLFQAILLNDLTNAQAHYYYASCLAKNGEHSAASYEYEKCLQFSRDSKLTMYAHQAINNLRQLAAEEQERVAHPHSIADKAKMPGATKHFDQQADRLLAQLQIDHENKRKEWQKDLDHLVRVAELQLADDIAVRPNLKTELETKAAYKIRILKIDAQEPLKLIEDDYAKKVASFTNARENLKAQMHAKVGASQVVPANTNLTVRNYMNFGGVREKEKPAEPISPGLKARAGVLGNSKTSHSLRNPQAKF